MESLENEQLFDSIRMAIYHSNNRAARHVFYDALSLTSAEIIEDCIDLAIKHDAFYLVIEFEKMKVKYTTTD